MFRIYYLHSSVGDRIGFWGQILDLFSKLGVNMQISFKTQRKTELARRGVRLNALKDFS
jgi:hypothetical protein